MWEPRGLGRASACVPNELRISYDARTPAHARGLTGRAPLERGAVRPHHARAVRSVSEHDLVSRASVFLLAVYLFLKHSKYQLVHSAVALARLALKALPG